MGDVERGDVSAVWGKVGGDVDAHTLRIPDQRT
jgi:hypothetical protein